jgi:hypothetical protein
MSRSRRHEKSGDRDTAQLDRTHRAELSDSHLRQVGHLQSRGTGALCIQRDGGELALLASANTVICRALPLNRDWRLDIADDFDFPHHEPEEVIFLPSEYISFISFGSSIKCVGIEFAAGVCVVPVKTNANAVMPNLKPPTSCPGETALTISPTDRGTHCTAVSASKSARRISWERTFTSASRIPLSRR